MKKSIFTIALTTIIAGTIITSCNSSTKKVEDAAVKVEDAAEDLTKAKEEFNAEYNQFKIESEQRMIDNDNQIAELKANNYKLNLETSGAYPLSGAWDWICFSPKKFKEPLPEVADKADELKVVIFNKSDFDWAETNRDLVSSNSKLYLQPEWSKRNEMTPLIIDYVKQHPEWEISMQLHKYINVP